MTSRPNFSAFIRTHTLPHITREVAVLVRPLVDELLIIADARMPHDELETLAAAPADRLLRIPGIAPPERPTAWAHAQCRGRWVLRLDGDEIPSRRLLDALPALTTDERFTHYLCTRTWLWPDAATRLDERPWWPDPQPRLVRNDPSLAVFPGQQHASADVVGPSRMVDLPLHHADLMLTDIATRREKVARYDVEVGDQRLLGRPINEAIYLPELLDPPPRLAPIDPLDAAEVRRILATGPEPRRALEPPPVAPLAEVNREGELVDAPPHRHAGRLAHHADGLVEVTNTGELPWWWRGRHAAWIATLAGRIDLPGPLDPGQSTLVEAPTDEPLELHGPRGRIATLRPTGPTASP